MENEPQGEHGKKHVEGTWDGKKMEIAGSETATPNNIRNALKHCAAKPGVKIAVLFFPENNFTAENFELGFAKYSGLRGTSQYTKFEFIYCIGNNEIIQRKKPD